MSESQSTRSQSEIQQELERRDWAEPQDSVMAEYVCVLLSNGNPREKVQAEMEDLVGEAFESSFLDWLFNGKAEVEAAQPSATAPSSVAASAPSQPAVSQPPSRPAAGSRMFSSAVEGTKRKVELIDDAHNKRRLLDTPPDAPAGPRAWQNQNQNQNQNQQQNQNRNRNDGGRSLADRLTPAFGGRGGHQGAGGGLNVRGAANGRGGFGGPGMVRPQFRNQQPQGPGGMMPGQQEMMMQMMAMQANMAQMAHQMNMMSQEKSAQTPAPTRAPNKLAPGTKLGKHAVSSAPPKANVGPIPDKPTSTALCKFGVGCTNSRCIHSHPSPAADEKSGMVLSEEVCEAGKDCKDAECVKSHISPAAVHGASAGPSRIVCKFQNCTNASCQFRHEDAEGNLIPPPALSKGASTATRKENASSDDEAPTFSLDRPLGDLKTPAKACHFGERCTRADCKFSHPSSRPTPRGVGPANGAGGDSIGDGMTASRKFAAPSATASVPLNPAAGEFKPAASADKEELGVTM